MADEDLRELERRWAEGQGDLAAGEAFSRALERAGADTGRRLHVRQQVLARQLVDMGLGPVAVSPLPEVDPFAFSIAVPGRDANEVWQRLRARSEALKVWPVIVGATSTFERVVENLSETSESAGALLVRAETLSASEPRTLQIERFREFVEMARAHDRSEDVQRLELLLEQMKSAPAHAPADEPWPADVSPWSGFSANVETTWNADERRVERAPHSRVHLALLPSTVPWHAAAYLRFGGFNACPPAHEHVALHRRWHERFGAEPVAITTDVVEMHVARPPTTQEAALALADEHLACESEGEQGRTRLAARLLGASVWHFWWD